MADTLKLSGQLCLSVYKCTIETPRLSRQLCLSV